MSESPQRGCNSPQRGCNYAPKKKRCQCPFEAFGHTVFLSTTSNKPGSLEWTMPAVILTQCSLLRAPRARCSGTWKSELLMLMAGYLGTSRPRLACAVGSYGLVPPKLMSQRGIEPWCSCGMHCIDSQTPRVQLAAYTALVALWGMAFMPGA